MQTLETLATTIFPFRNNYVSPNASHSWFSVIGMWISSEEKAYSVSFLGNMKGCDLRQTVPGEK